jgi:hypothetical protein
MRDAYQRRWHLRARDDPLLTRKGAMWARVGWRPVRQRRQVSDRPLASVPQLAKGAPLDALDGPAS